MEVEIIKDALEPRKAPLLIEAICLVVKDEINILRSAAGLPERTNQQAIAAIRAKLQQIGERDNIPVDSLLPKEL